MKKNIFIALLLSGLALSAHAQVEINKNITVKQAQYFVKPLLESQVRPYGEQRIPTYEQYGKPEKWSGVAVKRSGDSQFAWLVDEQLYFSNIAGWVDNAEPTPGCKKRLGDEGNAPDCDSVILGSTTCFLFMFDQNQALATVAKLHIERGDLRGKPACYEVKAMAPAGAAAKDGLLITLDYHDSTWRCSNGIMCANDIETPDIKTHTVLLRLKHDAQGKLQAKQDDSCLGGNPNGVKTIASARALLKKNACH
jgi:hypothetical protein